MSKYGEDDYEIELSTAHAMQQTASASASINQHDEQVLNYCRRIDTKAQQGLDMLEQLLLVSKTDEENNNISIETELHLELFDEEKQKLIELLEQTKDIATRIRKHMKIPSHTSMIFPHFTTQTLYNPWNECAHELNRLILMLENRLYLGLNHSNQAMTTISNPLLLRDISGGSTIDEIDNFHGITTFHNSTATRTRFPTLSFFERLYDVQGRLNSRGRMLIGSMCFISICAIVLSSVLTTVWWKSNSASFAVVTNTPTEQPSRSPHFHPSIRPTMSPIDTHSPSISPSQSGTDKPSDLPTVSPSFSQFPSRNPTAAVSNIYTQFKALLSNKPAWGIYCAERWVASDESGEGALIEAQGLGHNAVATNVTGPFNVTGHGAVSTIVALKGSIDGSILWPSGSIPQRFTICALTRYASDISSKHQRILQSTSNKNWYLGYRDGSRGVASFDTVVNDISMGPIMDWLVICGINPINAPNNLMVDGGFVGRLPSHQQSTYTLSINIGSIDIGSNENSEWEFSQLYIWNQTLSKDEVSSVSNALLQYIDTGKRLCP